MSESPVPPPPRPGALSVGRVLARSVSIWARGLPAFATVSFLVFAPLVAWTLHFTAVDRSPEAAESAAVWMWMGAMLLIPLVGAGVVHGTLARLHGRPAGIATLLSTGLTRFFPVLCVTLLTWLYAILAHFALSVVARPILSATRAPALDDALAVGSLLLTCWITAIFYVAVPVTVLERPGARESMRRSASLTRGHRWRLFLLALLWYGLGEAAARGAGEILPGSLSLPFPRNDEVGAAAGSLGCADEPA